MSEWDFIPTNRDKMILRELSADSRASLTRLGKAAGCSALTASKLVDRLVKNLDIRFTLEIDLNNLGFSERHMISVRFGRRPDEEFLRSLFRDDPVVHDAYLTDGDYGLVIFAATDSPMGYMKWETDLASNLSDYLPELRPSEYIHEVLGYMPLDNSFVDHIKEVIKIDKKDRQILQLLNGNSRVSYREMGKRLGMNEDTIRYRVFKLQRKGVIRRFTIAAQRVSGSISTFFMRFSFDKRTIPDLFPEQRKHNMNEDEPLPLLNRTVIVALMSGSYRFFSMSYGKTKEQALATGLKWHLNLVRNNNPHEIHAMFVKPIKGLLPLRNLDPKRYYRFIWT
ncbi:MAG: AsnC family transcriptional regulator [Candidatus Micrarchaeota archaeon]|nr:AsnC family transcriptional regulator [Candidatus Micrarchaeota archaeon]